MLPELGITRIANVTGLDWIGIPVVMVCRPTSRSLAVSQGKGTTLNAAKVSGVMESIEMHHSERPDLPLRLASFSDLKSSDKPVIQIDRLCKIDDTPFPVHRPLLWATGKDLFSGNTFWTPFELATIDDSFAPIPRSGCLPSNTNGLASGNNKAEASVHALCELIERDASTLWHLSSVAARARTYIDASTVDDPVCLRLLCLYEAARIDVFIFETTSDSCIASFEVLIRERDGGPSRDCFAAAGSGCHLHPGIALSRALTEAAQCRLTLITGAREDIDRGQYTLELARRHELDQYIAAAGRIRRSFGLTPTLAGNCFEYDLEQILERLGDNGMDQAVILDLTSERFGIAVVRAIVPGLEGVLHEAGFVGGERACRVTL